MIGNLTSTGHNSGIFAGMPMQSLGAVSMSIPPSCGFETLYKTDSPKDFANGEYYQVHLDSRIDEATRNISYFVREKHGYFDVQHNRAVNHITIYSRDGTYQTLEHALERYEQQLANRAADGFVHSFSLDPFEGMQYRRLTQARRI